nr:unnamed protein product [Callosobruchus analis]
MAASKEHIYKYILVVTVHRVLETNLPVYLFDKLIFRGNARSRQLRHDSLLDMPINHTSLFQRSFTYNVVVSYNAISPHIKTNQDQSLQSNH